MAKQVNPIALIFPTMDTRKKSTVIGSALRTRRKELGLTLHQIGRLVGMNFAAVRRLETSPTSNPQLVTLQKFAGALGVTVAELVANVPVIEPEAGE